MAYPHIIRLGEPWQNDADQDGICFCRSFNCPTGLEDHEQVWLVVEIVDRVEQIRLNDQILGEAPWTTTSCSFDITSLLANRNRIRIFVADLLGQSAQNVFGPVRLEIRLGPATN